MSAFDYKDIYVKEGKRILEVNLLPEKYCNFDCIICPIGRSKNQVDTQRTFDTDSDIYKELEQVMLDSKPDLFYINSKGEAFINDKLMSIIEFVKSKGIPVRLLSNGYLLGKEQYMKIANECNEVIGELKVLTESDFQKVQRPIIGYTLDEYINNMIAFRQQYKGIFIFEVTIMKGYNDDNASIEKLKKIIQQLCPDQLQVVRLYEEVFQKKLGITEERRKEIESQLQLVMQY